MTSPTNTPAAATWSCRNCANRAYNRTLEPFGENVRCALCGTRETRREWSFHILYGCPMPQPEARTAKVAETGAWACEHCLGTNPNRTLDGAGGAQCADCHAPEVDQKMVRLAWGW